MTVLTFSFLITRFVTAALALTGLSYELARLQAVSPFSCVGFSTSESERIVSNPARRRILIVLMILGNAGIVTAVSTLILSFIGATDQSQWLSRGTLRLVGLALFWSVATSQWIEQRVLHGLQSILRRFTNLDVIDFVELLDLSGCYSVRTLKVEPDDWVEGKRLDEVKLFWEGITVLGVHRAAGDYSGIPRGETTIEAHDQLVIYECDKQIRDLEKRRREPSGDDAHSRAVTDQQRTASVPAGSRRTPPAILATISLLPLWRS